ncbi:MAG: DNA repair protein RadA [bacterium]|nr:DNA repair protein RadA [bacterium]
MKNTLTTIYVCSNCDAQTSKWSGRCLECSQWGTLSESVKEVDQKGKTPLQTKAGETISFADIESASIPRIQTGIGEFDQVLGGGVVPGSFILLGGEPGIGKSTILLQVARAFALQKRNVLYCSGEESGQQIKLRLDRLTKGKGSEEQYLHFFGETNTEKICSTITQEKPGLAIVDSIQTIYSSEIPSECGSVTQVRACTVKLLEVAKAHHIPIIITGHVTKEGMVAGPKTLEHLVDTVLYLEGDNNNYFRLLKTVKNRFGSTNEVGIFEMTDGGLQEVSNPSVIFMAEREGSTPGTVTTAVLEGSRAFLIQVQALTSKTYFGYPQRRVVGFDANRLQLLIAVLTKRLGLNLGDQDIHVNIVGGLKISEPAIDLAVCASIISAYKNKSVGNDTVLFGEVGLNGEIRQVNQSDKRVKEAEKLGFKTIYLPAGKKIESKAQLFYLKNIKELEL